jgi:hypothetical protein
MTATRLPRAVSSRLGGIFHDGLAGRRDAGGIGQRQVALIRHALCGFHRQFARARQAVIGEGCLAKIVVHGKAFYGCGVIGSWGG